MADISQINPAKPQKVTYYRGFFHTGSVACWLAFETKDPIEMLAWVSKNLAAGRSISCEVKETFE